MSLVITAMTRIVAVSNVQSLDLKSPWPDLRPRPMLKRDIVTHRSYTKRTTMFAAVQIWFA